MACIFITFNLYLLIRIIVSTVIFCLIVPKKSLYPVPFILGIIITKQSIFLRLLLMFLCWMQDREQASANLYSKTGDKSVSSHEGRGGGGGGGSLRRSARKSNLKPTGPPSRGSTVKSNPAL
jgi:hypothetical protein